MPDFDTVVSIDPGRDKCGVAVVNQKGTVMYKTVIARNLLYEKVYELLIRYDIHAVVVGDGTSSKETIHRLGDLKLEDKQLLAIIKINEYRSTDQARLRYWQDNPPKGLKKFIPITLQVPPVPVDDYVAVILAERYFDAKID